MIRKLFLESQAKRGASLKIDGPRDLLAFVIATAGGAGMMPFGPGTWGSLVGLGIVYGLVRLLHDDMIALQNWLIVASLGVTAVGIWAGNHAETIFGRKDPGQVVIDEVSGQMITFVFFAPYLERLGGGWTWWLIPGFILFRAGDILKPYPIDKLQDLSGGFGVMMDDVLAGIYAAVVMSLLLFFLGS
ncbi:MAG: phosphatidylglycerophosphatase A [Acidobacteria bacterium]|nr:phosphatidylglycerophosphatase A [Acidobacteriota bacterium]